MRRFIYVFVVCSTVLFYCYYDVIMDKVMNLLVRTYLLIRHYLMSMCPICEQYLYYVHSAV